MAKLAFALAEPDMLQNVSDITHFALNNLLPGMVKVFRIEKIEDFSQHSLLHKHFSGPLSASDQQQLVVEIAHHLSARETGATYSYFHRSANRDQCEWNLTAASINSGTPLQVVLFTYDLELLGDSKNKLYRVLENHYFFKANYANVARLTNRERDIIGRLATGASSSEIAKELYISPHTVQTHRKHIKRKLAISTTAELVRVAEVFQFTPQMEEYA